MGVVFSLSRRKGRKAKEAEREQQKKVEQLCEMFPMLDKVSFVQTYSKYIWPIYENKE